MVLHQELANVLHRRWILANLQREVAGALKLLEGSEDSTYMSCQCSSQTIPPAKVTLAYRTNMPKLH